MNSKTMTSFSLFAALAFAGWGGAAFSTWQQKTDADRLIRDTSDISAIQVQQLNGSVTSHAMVALLIACALTIPFLIAALWALVEHGNFVEDMAEWDPPSAEPTSDGTF